MGEHSRFVEYLVEASTYVRSIDGFLVKLGSVIVEIEEHCRLSNCNPRRLLEEIVSDARLDKLFGRLSCYKENVVQLVSTDPRHRRLREYLDILKRAVEERSCIEEETLTPHTPPPTWIKETVEAVTGVEAGRVKRVRPRWRAREEFVEKIQILGVVIVSTILIISLVKLFLLK